MIIKKCRIQLSGAFFAAFVFFPTLSQAATWADLWLTPDQQAAHLLSTNPKEAAKKFKDPAWRAVAEYRAGDYDAALKDFSRLNTAESNYNRGNTFAQLGEYQDALAAYDQSLKQDPKNEDAQYNRALIEKLLQQPHQQNQPSQNNSSKNKNSNQKSDKNKNQQSSSSDQKNQPNQSQNNSKQSSQPQNDQSKPQANPSQPIQDHQNQESDPTQTNQQDVKQPSAKQTPISQNPQQEQAMQQWLQSIPDDPGGLLRQKFLRDHQQKMAQAGV